MFLKFTLYIGLLSLFPIIKCQLIRCTNNPCKNGARCVNQPSTFYGYNCICQGPWSGINCDQYQGNFGVNQQNNNPIVNNYPYNNNNNNFPYNSNNFPYNNDNNNYPYKNNNPYVQPANPCISAPCFNGAVCQPNGGDSYFCLCRYGFYGNRCESIDNPKGKLLAIILGTILPFFAIVIIISIIIYCCCCRRRKN
ncbi:unnamed protein product [Brachionus calyciflorus]|uniref:EGF-like domain-containing protein n=1 Tax=Brachionus calyciflorus TaxID=104777 RepID=A0A813XM83_9BILA|nr:unnamed protein product [Brachionus calyciflorus]